MADWKYYINVVRETDMPKLRETEDIDEAMRIIQDIMILINIAGELARKKGETEEYHKAIYAEDMLPEVVDKFSKLIKSST